MNRSDLNHFVDSWIRYHTYSGDPPEDHPDEWAMIQLYNYVRSEPELAWKLILAILDRDVEKQTAGMLASGPLEDLLGDHGSSFIDRVEFEAKHDPDFAELLSGVWLNDVTDEISARLQKVANTNGCD